MKFETFKYPLLIREHHLDTFGHVNNATYLKILEEARWEFVNARGFGIDAIQKMGIGPTILEWHMKFRKEIRLRQQITIESVTLSYERKIGIIKQDIFNSDNELCFEGQMTLGLFDMKSRKLIPPTPEWLYALGMIR